MILPNEHKQYVVKKYLFDLLQEKYAPNQTFIDRITHYLVTDQDMQDFTKMFVDTFERGYLKAVNDYREQFKKIGYDVNIVPEKKN